MKKILFLAIFTLSISAVAQTNQEIWLKNSTELKIVFKKLPFDIRYRPIEQMLMPTHYFGKHSLIRTDLLLGVGFWNMKLFSYTKYNEFNQFWTGIRFDFNLFFFDKKLLVNLQERFFGGLNPDSDDHYYLIQFINYTLTDYWDVGILAFGTWDYPSKFADGNWFAGPSVMLNFPFNLSFHLAHTKDLLHTNLNMIYLKTNYKIKF